MKILIRNATVYDPLNGVDGETRDLYIRNGLMSHPFQSPDRVINAAGFWALPGGIEAGSALTAYGLPFYAFQQGLSSDPATVSAAYAHMGYTHLHESMMFPTTSPATHWFLSSLPYQDGSASLCLALREFGGLIGANTPPEWTVRFLDTCAQRFRALCIHLPETHAHFRESNLSRYNIPVDRVLAYLAHLPLNLPLHIETTSRLLDEELPDVPYLFYHHIGQAIDGEYALKQATGHLARGKMKGDMGLTPLFPFHTIQMDRETSTDARLTVHLGLHAPIRYTLATPSPSQAAISLKLATHPDHKGKLAFSSLGLGIQAETLYPPLFQRLFETVSSYTVGDFTLQTRGLPAIMLGLRDKGHLGIGAVGDVALYRSGRDIPPGEILRRCHTLIKGGIPVMEDGRFIEGARPMTQTYYSSYTPSERDFALFASYFKAYPRFEHLEAPKALGKWKAVETSPSHYDE